MPGPYDITQVDIPGVYGAVQNARMGRIQQMLGERQIQAADRQAERDNATRLAITRLFGGSGAAGGASGASSATGATPAPNPVVAAYGGVPPGPAQPTITPPGLPGADPAGTSATTPYAARRVDAASAQALIAADPEHGPALVHALNQMSDEDLTSAQNRLKALAPLYANMAHIPYQAPGTQPGAARRAFIQSVMPQIQQMGIDPQQAMGWDPTDANLNAHMSFGQTMSEAMDSARPHLMVAPMNADIINPEDINPATGQPRVVFQSQFVGSPTEPYLRPQGMRTGQAPPQPGEVRQTSRGPMRFRGGDYRDPANYDPVQGGAPQPNAAGTFPRQDGGGFDFRVNP